MADSDFKTRVSSDLNIPYILRAYVAYKGQELLPRCFHRPNSDPHRNLSNQLQS